MLDKNDLKQISELLDLKLEEKFNQKLEPIHKELKEHGKILKSHGEIFKYHEEIFKSQNKILKSHGKLLRSLKKDQDTMLNMLDREQMEQRKKIKRIEEHLDIIPLSF